MFNKKNLAQWVSSIFVQGETKFWVNSQIVSFITLLVDIAEILAKYFLQKKGGEGVTITIKNICNGLMHSKKSDSIITQYTMQIDLVKKIVMLQNTVFVSTK